MSCLGVFNCELSRGYFAPFVLYNNGAIVIICGSLAGHGDACQPSRGAMVARVLVARVLAARAGRGAKVQPELHERVCLANDAGGGGAACGRAGGDFVERGGCASCRVLEGTACGAGGVSEDTGRQGRVGQEAFGGFEAFGRRDDAEAAAVACAAQVVVGVDLLAHTRRQRAFEQAAVDSVRAGPWCPAVARLWPWQGKFQSGPHAPSGVAAFMSAHSKTPYSTPRMDFYSGKGEAWGCREQQLKIALPATKAGRTLSVPGTKGIASRFHVSICMGVATKDVGESMSWAVPGG